MNSSKRIVSSNLAAFTSQKLQAFLMEIVNLNDSHESATRLARRFADFELFTFPFRTFGPTPGQEDDEKRAWLMQLRKVFRAIWLERDTRRREWNVAVLRVSLAMPSLNQMSAHGRTDPMALVLPEPLPESPLERALDFLLKWHYKARYCGNPDCPARYFFGTRSSQQYCSESCAEHGQREAKRRWWEAHGADWRKQQTKAPTAVKRKILKRTNKKARRDK